VEKRGFPKLVLKGGEAVGEHAKKTRKKRKLDNPCRSVIDLRNHHVIKSVEDQPLRRGRKNQPARLSVMQKKGICQFLRRKEGSHERKKKKTRGPFWRQLEAMEKEEMTREWRKMRENEGDLHSRERGA